MIKFKKKNSAILERNRPISYIMVGPWALMFIVFGVIPVIAGIFLSFTSYDMLNTPKFVGIDNFIRLFIDDDIFAIALKNTLIMAIVTGPLGYLLNFVFAWGINESPKKVRNILTFLFYAPSLGGSLVFIFQLIFSGDSYGLLNGFLLEYGLIDAPIQWLTNKDYCFTIVIIVSLWLSCGTGFLTFLAGLQSLNREYSEAGAIDGIRNRWQELFYITLPQMRPQLLYGAVGTISGSFGAGGLNASLTGNPSTDYCTHTISLHLGDCAFTKLEMGYAGAITIVLFAMMLTYWFFVNKALQRWSTD